MSRSTLRYILAGALLLAIGIPSVAVGFGEGRSLLLGKRNPSTNASRSLNAETEIIASTGTYGTRQSNKRDGDGGGAIYGCRSNAGTEPCIRSNNLKGGRSFEFETVGKEAGRIETGDPAGAPFTTNATGTATGLNADRVDGREGSDLAAAGDFKTAVVGAAGNLVRGRGATASRRDAGNTYVVTFNRDVSACAFTATPSGATSAQTLSVQNGGDPANVRVDADQNPTGFHLQVIC